MSQPLNSYHKRDGYDEKNLGVYLVKCNSKGNEQGSIILPVLAPFFDEYLIQVCSSKFKVYTASQVYEFTTAQYAKASAMTLASQIDLDPNDPNVWKPNSYYNSYIISAYSSVVDCKLYGYNKIINQQVSAGYSFNRMLLDFITYGRTTPVTLKELQNA